MNITTKNHVNRVDGKSRRKIPVVRLLVATFFLFAALLRLSAQMCDTCDHHETVNISSVCYLTYDPGAPIVGPPQASTVRGVFYDPPQYVSVVKTRYQFIDGVWEAGTPTTVQCGDCYNELGCGG